MDCTLQHGSLPNMFSVLAAINYDKWDYERLRMFPKCTLLVVRYKRNVVPSGATKIQLDCCVWALEITLLVFSHIWQPGSILLWGMSHEYHVHAIKRSLSYQVDFTPSILFCWGSQHCHLWRKSWLVNVSRKWALGSCKSYFTMHSRKMLHVIGCVREVTLELGVSVRWQQCRADFLSQREAFICMWR